MGLLDGLTSTLGGGGEGGMPQAVMGLLDQFGGLDGLLQRFQSAGLGDKVQSWVGTGTENAALSSEEVTRALGDDGLARVAEATGTDPAGAASGLADALPGLIDRLTPDGRLPDLGALQGLLGGLLK
jgi:uncharacterized protein YidB (DUF937 family)